MTRKPRLVGPPATMRQPGLRAWLRRDESSATHGEEGNTLIEVLLTLIIMSLAAVALMTGFATTIMGSSQHRALATFDTIITTTSQEAITSIQQQPALFTTCPANPVTYYQAAVPLTVAAPDTSNYTAQITAVQYWNGTAFTTACEKNQPQEVTVTVTRTGAGVGPVSYSNTFDITYPLAPSSAVSGTAASLVFSTEPGGASGGLPLSPQPQVTVEDANGVAVSNDLSPVVLSVTNNTGTIVGCSGSEVNGVVTFTGCAITTSGTYTLTASDANLPVAVSTSIVVSAAPPSLVFVSQPVASLSGSTLATQPTIDVETSLGVLVVTSTATISLSSSSGALTGCSNLTAVLGIIHPTGCAFAGLVGTYYTLTATSSGLVPGSSNSITPSGPGPATRLLFTTQPSGVAASSATASFSNQPVVTAEDSAGNIATAYTTPIKVAANTGNVVTCTNNTVTPTSGVAAFAACHNGAYANGITLTATSGALSVTSTSFNVTGLATKLVFVTQPVAGDSGTSFTTQPVLQVEDANGNIVTSLGVSISLTPSGGTLTQCAGLGTTSGVVNVASCLFAGLIGTNYTLTAASAGLASAVSTPFSPVGAGVESQLVFTTQPVAGASQSALSTEPVVKVEDSGGNVQTASADTITLTAGGGTLSNCTNLTAIAGVVDIQNCTFAGSMNGSYTLSATSGSLLPATSSTITPTGSGPASQVLISGCATPINWQTTCALSASVADEYNNVVTSFVGNITFSQAVGSTGAATGFAAVPSSSGTATDTITGTAVGTVLATAAITTPSFTSTALSVSVLPIPQTINWTPPATQTWVAGGLGTFSLGSATDSAASAVTFASSTQSVCTIAGTIVTMVTAGVCTITPTAAAQGNYLATVGTPVNITINQIAQVPLTLSSPTTVAYPYTSTLSTAGGSGTGTVSYSTTNGSASGCAVAGNVLTASSSGTCLVTAVKAADTNYTSSTTGAVAVTFTKAAQATLVTTTQSDTFPYSITLATTGGSGTGTTSYAVTNGTASGCAISGSTLTATSNGTCLVTATRTADGDYLSATSAAATETFIQAAQGTLSVNTTSATFPYSISLSTAGGSGTGTTSYAVTNGTASGCAISGSTLTATKNGTCLVTATRTADGDYLSATSAAATETFIQAGQNTLVTTTQSDTYPYSITLATTGGSGTGTTSYAVTNGTASGCAVAGTTLTATSNGTCLVTATRTADADYLSATSAAATETFILASQGTLTLTSTTGLRTGLTLATSGGSGSGAVTYSATNGTASGCSAPSGTLTATTSGTCLVTATKAATNDYTSATTGAVTVTLSNAGTYSGSSSTTMPNTPGGYYAINTLNSVYSTTKTNNALTPGVAEHLTSFTFTIDSSSSQDHTASVGIITGGVWTTALTCDIAGGSGLTSCTVTGSVNVPVGSSINVLVVSGSLAHTGTWSTTWTQP